ncbi:hypothetical protein HT594_00134 [Phenacoccus solenopsis nudivirus]|nr:hypothetical protein HT594_00134 [Phenacoccus solenopsis nudivirus]
MFSTYGPAYMYLNHERSKYLERTRVKSPLRLIFGDEDDDDNNTSSSSSRSNSRNKSKSSKKK